MYSISVSLDSPALDSQMSDLSLQLFPTEVRIVRTLHDLCAPAFAKELKVSEWTKEVFGRLASLGREDGYLILPDYAPDGTRVSSEWLFDMCWVNAKARNRDDDATSNENLPYDWRHTRSLHLIAECEWSTREDNILEDFFKLTFALAEIRLFVYTNPDARSSHSKLYPIDLCRRVCPLSRGFRYLCIGIPQSEKGNFRVDSWIA